MDYLGPLNILLYYTEGVFKQRNYGPESIAFQSTILNQQIDEKTPSWIRTNIRQN